MKSERRWKEGNVNELNKALFQEALLQTEGYALAEALARHLYYSSGAQLIRDACSNADWCEYGYCEPCDSEVPTVNDDCLLCGTMCESLYLEEIDTEASSVL